MKLKFKNQQFQQIAVQRSLFNDKNRFTMTR